MQLQSEEQYGLLQAHRDMLVDGLRRIFGDFNPEMLEKVLPRFEWVELAGGDILFRQGERDDSLYFVISGRLRASRQDAEGARVPLGDIARGETVGELAFFTQEPRSATISAVRDSVLARFSSTVFRELLIAYPMVSLNLTRLVIERLQSAGASKGQAKPVTIGIAAATLGVDIRDFAERLSRQLGGARDCIIVDCARADAWLGREGAAQVPVHDTEGSRLLMRKLEQVESEHRHVLLVADAAPTEWTRRCLRHCDQIVLVADARHGPARGAIEDACLTGATGETHAGVTLVLMHPAETAMPSGTHRWLEQRRVAQHIHMRPHLPRDWARLGRILGGNAVGLVLSGGGARGFAHLGVMKALAERGIEFDFVGGTSIGSAMGAYAAMDLPVDEAIDRARSTFRRNPTSDFNLVPLVSLIGGRRLREVIDLAVGSVMGEGSRIEDLWKNFFCVSSNYTSACETVWTAGPLAKSIRASVSIPGALPPVVLDGELHIDGGTFNNFPTDVMARRGAARIIGVNLLRSGGRRYTMEEVPSGWRLAFDKFRGKRHRLPGLVPMLLNTSIMSSYARQDESRRLVDLYFAPEARGCGMLDWGKFDRIVKAGYAHAVMQLDAADAESLEALAARPAVQETAGFGETPQPQGA